MNWDSAKSGSGTELKAGFLVWWYVGNSLIILTSDLENNVCKGSKILKKTAVILQFPERKQ